MSKQVNKATMKQNNLNKLGLSKSTVWYIVKKQECIGELSNFKQPGRPWKATIEEILLIVKKTLFPYVK